jgi:hypothetical protein
MFSPCSSSSSGIFGLFRPMVRASCWVPFPFWFGFDGVSAHSLVLLLRLRLWLGCFPFAKLCVFVSEISFVLNIFLVFPLLVD